MELLSLMIIIDFSVKISLYEIYLIRGTVKRRQFIIKKVKWRLLSLPNLCTSLGTERTRRIKRTPGGTTDPTPDSFGGI